MFRLPYSDELLLEEDPILVQDLALDHTDFVETPKIAPKILKKRQRIAESDVQENQKEESNEGKQRKIMHRDIERQRRQEMTSLYSALRNLLPLEYIKGKRAVCDHMQEAVNYIKHMQKNIKDLQRQKDKLKSLSSFSSFASENGSSNSLYLPNCVTVNSCCQGVEILIDCGLIKEGNNGFSVSRVIMELMLHTQLNILSCISTRTNERILCRILSEVDSLAYIDLCELQQRLANVIN